MVLTKKSGQHSAWVLPKDELISCVGLKSKIQVIAGPEYFPVWLGRVRSKLSELRQLLYIIFLVYRISPDIIYIDHSNIWAAGILSRLFSRCVILRLMGVYPTMRQALQGGRVAHAIQRWCYRAPYRAVICTQDGSGIEPWLDKALSPDVPRFALLNGADPVSCSDHAYDFGWLPQARCIVMFVGKLEYAKGADRFVEAFLLARNLMPNRLHAVVIGVGSLLADLRAEVERHSANNDFSFLERLPHSGVSAALCKSDIYVSLNRLGNLSNANLEAMRAGCCMVLPASQPQTCVDVFTDQILPADAVCRIPSTDDVIALSSLLVYLAENPAKRRSMGNLVRERSSEFLVSWDTRIKREFDLITATAEVTNKS